MSEHICVRLTCGSDLKESICRITEDEHIACGAVISAVGCLSSARLRTANGKTVVEINEHCEIVSLTGTVSESRCHLHISLAKSDLSVIGGHLVEGCIVNTTCELIIQQVPGFRIEKVFDESTGYNELVFVKE